MQTPSENSIVPIGLITQKIYFVRSARVMLDADLARLYGGSHKEFEQSSEAQHAPISSGFHVPAVTE